MLTNIEEISERKKMHVLSKKKQQKTITSFWKKEKILQMGGVCK